VFSLGCSRANFGKAAAVFIAAAFLFLARVQPAQAVQYVGEKYFTIRADDQFVQITKNDVNIPVSTVGWSWYVRVDYDWDFDGNVWANWAHADDSGAPDYDGQVVLACADGMNTVTLPMDPKWETYLIRAHVAVGSDSYQTLSILVNRSSAVTISNDEPTPVRIQEIGAASTATTLAANYLPTVTTVTAMPAVSLDSSISVDGTLPVDVQSFLGESDGPVVWAVFGSLCGVGSILALDKLVGRSTRDH